MTREDFEELLPAYLEGDLDEDTCAEVRAALVASAELRASLDALRSLEDALVVRREQVPPASQFLGWLPEWSLVRTMARRHARSPMYGFFNTFLSWPSLTTLGLFVAGMWSYWHKGEIAAFFNESNVDTSRVESGFASMLTSLAGGDMMVMIGIYAVVTLGILAVTGAITMRFIRSH